MTEHGFSDAAVDSSHAFRAIMQAMARPGQVQELACGLSAPEPLFATTAAVALTLCDFQTPLWLSPALRTEDVTRYLRFHSGAPITSELDEAHFAFASADDILPDPAAFMHGSHEYPDRGATLVIQATDFRPGLVELSGPGISTSRAFGVAGFGTGFWQAMAANHARFPIGIDVIFVVPGLIAALPRSTAVRVLEAA